jgi:hypothetical protein
MLCSLNEDINNGACCCVFNLLMVGKSVMKPSIVGGKVKPSTVGLNVRRIVGLSVGLIVGLAAGLAAGLAVGL